MKLPPIKHDKCGTPDCCGTCSTAKKPDPIIIRLINKLLGKKK